MSDTPKLKPTYTCTMCGGTFEYVTDGTWTDEMAHAEYAERFKDNPNAEPVEQAAIICEDCYLTVTGQTLPNLIIITGGGS